MRKRKSIFLIGSVVFVFSVFSSLSASAEKENRVDELARHWAPIFYQDTDELHAEADYILQVDCDGDWNTKNNWEHFNLCPKQPATVYVDLSETASHWFLGYFVYHPIDWFVNCDLGYDARKKTGSQCHENDMEGAFLVIAKDGTRFGQFRFLVTVAHGRAYFYTGDPQVRLKNAAQEKQPPLTFNAASLTFKGSHVELYIEPMGHGITAMNHVWDPTKSHHGNHPNKGTGRDPFLHGDGIVYSPKDRHLVPRHGNDRRVGYRMVELRELWDRRNDGELFCGEQQGLPAAFCGDTYGDHRANPPWAWQGGELFMMAKKIQTWMTIPEPFSSQYEHHLFNMLGTDLGTRPVPLGNASPNQR